MLRTAIKGYPHATVLGASGQVLGPKGAARPRNDSLARIRELLDRHITLEDSAVFESITGTSLRQLRHALMGAPNVTVDRFLSADRWLHSELNAQGLHMLRCTLAERAVNERRRALGVTAHPDYADFMRDGFLILWDRLVTVREEQLSHSLIHTKKIFAPHENFSRTALRRLQGLRYAGLETSIR